MKETEITVQVFDSLDRIDKVLKDKGFKIVNERLMSDWYYSKFGMSELRQMGYSEMIANSFLVRRIVDKHDLQLLTYKKKEINDLGTVISEEKIECKIDSVEQTLNILNAAGLTCWSHMKQKMLIYSNDQMEFALQIIDDLGIFIEYEEDDTMLGLDEYAKIKLMSDNLNQIGLKLGSDLSCKKVYMKFIQE